MARSRTGTQILTANRLDDGEVVYFSPSGEWTERLDQALVIRDKEDAERRLARAGEDVARQLIVEPYLFDIDPEEAEPRPIETREAIRALGPTVRTDLGKQAAHGAA